VRGTSQPDAAGRIDRRASGTCQRIGSRLNQRGEGDEPADACRPDVGRCVQEPADRLQAVQSRAADEPADERRANEHLDLGAGLVQQRGRLDRALAAADDDHLAAAEHAQVAVLGRMGGELGRQRREERRSPGEPRDCRRRARPAAR